MHSLLALASQALSTMISLIPYVWECLRHHLSPKQAVMLVDFDKLKRDYQEHQNEIHAKLVSIMSDRLAMHHQTLQAIDWESLESLSSDPNPYLENLLKEVTTLHRVLSRYLLPSTLQAIMTQVFSAIHHTLSKEFSKGNVQSAHAKERLLQDVQFLSRKLNELNATDEIQEKVKDFQKTLNKKLLPKEAKSESNDDSAKVGSRPSTSPLTGNFRARFRFLSPGRPALKSPLPSPAQVEKPSNLSEDLPPTCPETNVAESEVALEQNQTSSTIENEIEEMPMQDNPTQSLGAAIPSLPIDPQPSQTHEPQLVLPLSETVTETSSPNPSQPPKLTLSQ
ncbi:hypothetical protein O181_090519 [Austropuccinia psidii MF-1]|uniref:Vacuolar protein sorting-associated protein 54 C-terminal domain-containing protein n=1 Tax=Austropuccinia psidii MF-1 TaxID=1389203 RepID=A0A9Q3P702_9BASI|nr:hypothetical protein [Austropuccinia psidii MF-1]